MICIWIDRCKSCMLCILYCHNSQASSGQEYIINACKRLVHIGDGRSMLDWSCFAEDLRVQQQSSRQLSDWSRNHLFHDSCSCAHRLWRSEFSRRDPMSWQANIHALPTLRLHKHPAFSLQVPFPQAGAVAEKGFPGFRNDLSQCAAPRSRHCSA